MAALFGCRKSDYIVEGSNMEVIQDNGQGTGTTTWTADKEYLLDGFVFVNDGQVLTIEAGTVIRAKTGQGEYASALIVARGGQIMAEGTVDAPIIFTCAGDDLEGSVPVKSQGLWGGVIILGEAPINTSSGEAHIEGIPSVEFRGIYGGSKDDDNSGVFKYVSIRHGGTNIGDGNEINGLTLGGVGNETEIEYVEVISNLDDGVEVFGGAARLKHIAVAFCGDDAFDFDQGYHGMVQFVLGIQDAESGDMLIECDGGEAPYLRPYTNPMVYNATLIGGSHSSLQQVADYKNNGSGDLGNSVFVHQTNGLRLQYEDAELSSYQQFLNGYINFYNNIFYQIGDTLQGLSALAEVVDANGSYLASETQTVISAIENNANTIENTGIQPLEDVYQITPDYPLNNDVAEYPHEWFDKVGYKGCIGTALKWTSGWTLLDQRGLID